MKKITTIMMALALSFGVSASYAGGKGSKAKAKAAKAAAAKEEAAPKKKDPKTTYPEVGGASQTIRWDKMKWSFGDKEYGSDISHSYVFYNDGPAPLTVSNVAVGCGCTASDYTKEIIQPGKTGTVTAKFNNNTIPGNFNKNLTVTFSNGDNVTLWFDGVVKPAAGASNPK